MYRSRSGLGNAIKTFNIDVYYRRYRCIKRAPWEPTVNILLISFSLLVNYSFIRGYNLDRNYGLLSFLYHHPPLLSASFCFQPRPTHLPLRTSRAFNFSPTVGSIRSKAMTPVSYSQRRCRFSAFIYNEFYFAHRIRNSTHFVRAILHDALRDI